jgi:hypothetical protein
MGNKRYRDATIILVLSIAIITLGMRAKAQVTPDPPPQSNSRPPNATACDISIPIRISMVPLNVSQVGSAARFRVAVESSLDPDLVRSMKVEYEVPARMPRTPDFNSSMEIPQRTEQGSYEFGVVVPDESRYRIRVRLVVQLVDGRTISQTATRWINLGKRVPDDLVGIMETADGAGILIYRGLEGSN